MNEHPKRVALVSGGANGIGAGIAARLSRDGWRVVVADRDSGGAAPLAAVTLFATLQTKQPLLPCSTRLAQRSGDWTR
jgi:NAD(P)-dependent dehydrogenase (short-subunit alcohol dehydrogenase family)